MMTDPIADMLTRIRNASNVERPAVEMPATKLKIAIAIIDAAGQVRAAFRIEQEGNRSHLTSGSGMVDRCPAISGVFPLGKEGSFCLKEVTHQIQIAIPDTPKKGCEIGGLRLIHGGDRLGFSRRASRSG